MRRHRKKHGQLLKNRKMARSRTKVEVAKVRARASPMTSTWTCFRRHAKPSGNDLEKKKDGRWSLQREMNMLFPRRDTGSDLRVKKVRFCEVDGAYADRPKEDL